MFIYILAINMFKFHFIMYQLIFHFYILYLETTGGAMDVCCTQMRFLFLLDMKLSQLKEFCSYIYISCTRNKINGFKE